MKFLADLHIHSKFSMATSREADLEHLAQSGLKKGLNVIATGDFTHPIWFEELKSKLIPAEEGLFRLRPDLEREVLATVPSICAVQPVRFVLSVEISTIYKWANKTRKVHHVIYAKSFEEADALRRTLGRVGNLASDGRPILGLSSRDLLDAVLNSGSGSFLVPAHIWTPWFSALGSKSGFDAIADCYADLSDHIFAVETGLSSDPSMNWRVSSLDGYQLISNSDAHSPAMLGREANAFDCELSYDAIRHAMATGEGFVGTVEFFPEEGKYHLDGHRNCNLCLTPNETKAFGGRCPKCGGIITVGVQSRVEDLADRLEGVRPPKAADFQCIIPLPEVLSEILQVGVQTKRVKAKLEDLIHRFGPELSILRDVPLDDVKSAGENLLAEALGRLRRGEVHRSAGFDGQFGVIRLFEDGELKASTREVRGLFPKMTHEPLTQKRPLPDQTPSNSGHLVTEPTQRAVTLPSENRGDGSHQGTTQGDHDLLAPLDEDQRQVALMTEGPVLVVAGPGTGKTGTLTRRLAHLIVDEGVSPNSCLAVTFTRKAAGEMRCRLKALLGHEVGEGIRIHTFHSLCLEILREDFLAAGLPEHFQVVDGGQKGGSVQILWKEAFGDDDDSRQRAQSDQSSLEAAQWNSFLATRGLVDLESLVPLTVAMLKKTPSVASKWQQRFLHMSVDEFQDVDAHQYELIHCLSKASVSLCAIGDPDQAIYGFRGSDVGFFLRFATDYPGTREVHLTRNYRSLKPIVDAALAAIAPSSLVKGRALHSVRQSKALEPAHPVSLLVAQDERREAEAIAQAVDSLLGGVSLGSFDQNPATGHGEASHLSLSDVAILYRTDAQSLAIQEALFRRAIPFEKSGRDGLLSHRGVRQIRDSLQLELLNRVSVGESSQTAVWPWVVRWSQASRAQASEVVGSNTWALSEKDRWIAEAMELVRPVADRCDTLEAFLGALDEGDETKSGGGAGEKVHLMTMHAAKGLEFPLVIVAGCDDGLLPLTFGTQGNPSDPQATDDLNAEELRLLFVAMTRAQDRLVLTRAKSRHRFGQEVTTKISPLVAPLIPHCVQVIEVGARDPTEEGPKRRKGRQLKLF